MKAVMVAAKQRKEKAMQYITGYSLTEKTETELFNLFNEVSKEMKKIEAGSEERSDALLSLDNITRAIARYPG